MSGKRSKMALKAFLLAEDPDTLELADPRSAALLALDADQEVTLAAIREVFAGTPLPDDAERVAHLLRIRAEIHEEWTDARDAFLAIGRALLSLDEMLTRAERVRLRRGSARLFPFSDATATQLRQIARAVASGRLPQHLCPGSYGTAYQIALLSDAQMQAAQARGLIRPDVTRREILALRQEVHTIDGVALAMPSGRVDRAALRAEARRLAARRARLADEIRDVEQRLHQIETLLAGSEAGHEGSL